LTHAKAGIRTCIQECRVPSHKLFYLLCELQLLNDILHFGAIWYYSVHVIGLSVHRHWGT